LLEFIEIEKEVFLLMLKSNTFTDNNTKHLSFAEPPSSKSAHGSILLHENCMSLGKNKELEKTDNKKSTSEEFGNGEQDNIITIDDLIEKLDSNKEDKIKIIKKFVNFLKGTNKWPVFKKEDIARLFFGDFNKKRGLVFHCGTLNENQLGAEACLDFIGKLISFEFNPDCEFYIQILKKLRFLS